MKFFVDTSAWAAYYDVGDRKSRSIYGNGERRQTRYRGRTRRDSIHTAYTSVC